MEEDYEAALISLNAILSQKHDDIPTLRELTESNMNDNLHDTATSNLGALS